MKNGLKALIISALLTIIGCTDISTTPSVFVTHLRNWGIVTFTNNTEVPQAGNRAMSVTAGVLRSKGVRAIQIYPSDTNCNQLIVCPNAMTSVDKALHWARKKHLSYLVMGSVNEWDYKVGLDGEPAVAVSLQLYQVKTGQLIWSGVGSKIGTSRSGLGVIAQMLITQMLCSIKIN